MKLCDRCKSVENGEAVGQLHYIPSGKLMREFYQDLCEGCVDELREFLGAEEVEDIDDEPYEGVEDADDDGA